MKIEQLMQTMMNAGCNPATFFIMDREYSCPALDYLQNDFANDFALMLAREGLTEWKPEANDCDNFAIRAMDEAQKAHVRSRERDGNKGIAFGCFYYYPEWAKGGAHAINFAIIRAVDGSYHPVFFEPQSFGLRNLTQAERESCFGYYVS